MTNVRRWTAGRRKMTWTKQNMFFICGYLFIYDLNNLNFSVLQSLSKVLEPKPKLQFSSMSVQTHLIYVVKEFNKKVIKCIFLGEMEVITILCVIPVNNFQWETCRLHSETVFFLFLQEYRGLTESFVTWCNNNHLKLNISKTNELVVDCWRTRRPPVLVHPGRGSEEGGLMPWGPNQSINKIDMTWLC